MTLLAGGLDVWLSRRARESFGQASTSSSQPRSSLPEPVEIPVPENPYTNLVAEASVAQVPVFGSKGASKPRLRLPGRNEHDIPLVFLVIEQDGDWLRVHLPVRPNGSKGWIRDKNVVLSEHEYRIAIMLKSHRLLAFDGAELLLRARIAVGTKTTPTPGGSYYIKELYKLPNPNTIYGTYAYGLSGFSEVLTSFNGGEGVIGIHGTNDPSVLGSDVSAGCIRMRNRDIEKLVKELPLGTPVEIIR